MSVFYAGYIGRLPEGARGVVIDYREKGKTTWTRIGETSNPRPVIELPSLNIEVRQRVVFKSGRISSGERIKKFDAAARNGAASDRNGLAGLTLPAAVVDQSPSRPVLTVTQDLPAGEPTGGVTIEVRQGDSDTTDPEDALHMGEVEPGKPVDLWLPPGVDDSGETAVKVWTRPKNIAGDKGAWVSLDHEPADPTTGDEVGWDIQDFTTGVTFEDVDGVDLMEDVPASGFEFASIHIDDATMEIFEAGKELAQAGKHWSPATLTFDETVFQEPHTYWLSFRPILDTVTRPPMYIFDAEMPIHPGERSADAQTFVDNRIPTEGLEIFGDKTPMVIEVEVASTIDPTHTLVEADFRPYLPGQMIYAIKDKVRFRIYTWYERQIRWKNWRWRRWCCPVCCCKC